jgi:hypothetical protein
MRLDPEIAERWRGELTRPALAPSDETGFCILTPSSDEAMITSLSQRLHLSGRIENALSDAVRLRSQSSKLAAMGHDAVLAVDTLDRYMPSAVWATSIILGGDPGAACDTYLREWRHMRALLRGDDVIALGVEPGVAVGATLRALRDARLKGNTTTRADEEDLVRAMLKKEA